MNPTGGPDSTTAPPIASGQSLLLRGDVVREPVRYAEGAIQGLDGPGLGVEIDEAALREWTRR